MYIKQLSLATTGFELSTERTGKCAFLPQMDAVTPWTELLSLIAAHLPAGKNGRPPFEPSVMLSIHLLQQFFGQSDPAIEKGLHDLPLCHEFTRLDTGMSRIPYESTILRFRNFLEELSLGAQIQNCVNAQLARNSLAAR
jgi:IS5 family transposase